MLQLIKKIFSSKSTTLRQAQDKKNPGKKGKDRWAEKQFKEMGKLRGKLILM